MSARGKFFHLILHPPLRTRLIAGYGSILTIFLILMIVSGYQLNQVLGASRALEREQRAALAAQELSRASLELAVRIDEAIMMQDGQEFSTQIPPALSDFNSRYQEIKSIFAETTSLDFAVARLTSFINPMIIQAENASWDVVETNRLTRMGDSLHGMQEEIDRIVNQAEANQVSAQNLVQTAQNTLERNVIISFLFVVLLTGAMVYTTIRGVTKQVGALTDAANQLAAGDLYRRVEVHTKDEISVLGQAFNEMAEQLQSLYSRMEQIIADRTRELENLTARMQTSAEIASTATTVLDPVGLQELVVDLISERFDFYHVGIFLMDSVGEHAVLQAASSLGGKRMLARHHRLKIGQGVVGFAAKNRKARVAQNVGQDAVFFNNPNLPLTQAEAALPLRARGKVIGVLDVQSTQAEAFTPEYVAILQTLADQIALSFDNARLYQEAEERLEETRRLYGEYSREAWKHLLVEKGPVRYRFLPERGVFVERHGVEEGPNTEAQFVIPIKLRGQEIASLNLRKPGTEQHWYPAEIDVIEKIVEQVSIALESARLYESTQRQAERERLTGEISARIRETLDMEVVLQTAARELQRALNLPEVVIQLGRPGMSAPNRGNGHE